MKCPECEAEMLVDYDDYDIVIYKCPNCGHTQKAFRELP